MLDYPTSTVKLSGPAQRSAAPGEMISMGRYPLFLRTHPDRCEVMLPRPDIGMHPRRNAPTVWTRHLVRDYHDPELRNREVISLNFHLAP